MLFLPCFFSFFSHYLLDDFLNFTYLTMAITMHLSNTLNCCNVVTYITTKSHSPRDETESDQPSVLRILKNRWSK